MGTVANDVAALAAIAIAVLVSAYIPAKAELTEVSARIVNGTLSRDYPSAGAMLYVTNPQNPDGFPSGIGCSGTLIGCRTFLTAAHCVCDTSGAQCQEGGNGLTVTPAGLRVFLQNGGIFAVSSISVHPDYDFEVGSDLALLELTGPVTGIAPAAINTTGKPVPGTSGTIVGFGRSGGSPGTNGDTGLKRIGKVTTGSCTIVPDETHVCWEFSDPVGSPGADSNTCEGDSGGPLFVDFGAGALVAGVTSGGDSATCQPTDRSFDADVFANRAWIQSAAGDDLAAAPCGALPEVGDPASSVSALSGEITTQTSEGRHSIEVAAGVSLLRVTMNADESGGADFDLYVKAGGTATITDFDCSSTRNSQFESCEIATPAAGTWSLLVQRFAGTGSYQLTATLFTTGSPIPTPTPTPTPVRRTQTSDQQKCINGMNKSGSKVAGAQGKENVGCVQSYGKARVTDIDSCLGADPKGKVAKAKEKTAATELSQCKSLPDFGFAGTEAVNAAGGDESLALFADVFGTAPNETVVSCETDSDACRCQAAVAKDYEKLVAAKLKEFLKCKKTTLKNGADSAAALEACVTPDGIAADSRGTIGKKVDKLASTVSKQCTTNVFGGRCSTKTLADLASCIDERVECRVCRTTNAMDDLEVDCDLFDDGVGNGSCAGAGVPTPTPRVPAAQIDCGQTVNGDLNPNDPDLFGDGTFADAYVFTLGQTTDVQFTLTGTGFEPFVWVGAVDSLFSLFSGGSPQGGSLEPGTYNVIANNASPVAPGVYPYQLAMICTGIGGGRRNECYDLRARDCLLYR